MPDRLDSLLLTYRDPNWAARVDQVREALRRASTFEEGGPEEVQLGRILQQVRAHRDQALVDLTRRFDGVDLGPGRIRVSEEDLHEAHARIDPALLGSLRQAIENVRLYQSEIFVGDKVRHPGVRYTPIERVGVCVPGASAPLPSTVIMTAVPAQVAGVRGIAVVSPPRFQGSIHPVILAVCRELGITEVYRVGGAQAVAALAYGTETIRPVYKIVGPGNRWVQMAKRKVFGQVDIDSIAGPSEVLILADGRSDPAWVAADMLSQAEHAPGSAVVFTDSEPLARRVLAELKAQVRELGRSDQTQACLEQYSAIIVFEDLDRAVEAANAFASEHLEVQCGQASREVAARIRNAGAVFIGPYTPVAVGDYWAGPSHTLPTGMTARFFSPLSSNDFIKSSSLIEYDRAMLARASGDIIRLARTEGLDAHARSVEIRRRADA
ncbi:MAG: histidinol dehydrogenase [Phycisphaerae bacterium]|nr:histidinol dehydrogenase [Phycisphaerae bacterium]